MESYLWTPWMKLLKFVFPEFLRLLHLWPRFQFSRPKSHPQCTKVAQQRRKMAKVKRCSVIVMMSLSVLRVQLTRNSDFAAKFTNEKCVRANVFNELMPGIVEK